MTKRKTPASAADDDPRHGPTMARFKLGIAREAFRRLEGESFIANPNAWYLYAASTIVFARAALDALRDADGVQNKLILEEWTQLFHREVANHPIFISVLDGERDRISHGHLGIAFHPFMPIDTFFRHELDNAFKDPPVWPDGPLMGQVVDAVLASTLRQVSAWIDDVHARAQRRAPPRPVPEGVFESDLHGDG